MILARTMAPQLLIARTMARQLLLARAVVIATLLIAMTLTPGSVAESAPLADPLLNDLVGNWNVNGTVLGKPVHQRVSGSWVLAHQFMLLRFTGSYEANVYIGYDPPAKRYIAHWLDMFGGSGANAVGFGTPRRTNEIVFHFAYPGQPFETTFTYSAGTGTWHIHYRYQDKHGVWKTFGDETLSR